MSIKQGQNQGYVCDNTHVSLHPLAHCMHLVFDTAQDNGGGADKLVVVNNLDLEAVALEDEEIKQELERKRGKMWESVGKCGKVTS